ncbi:MAG: hypothetical protein ACPGSM_17740, partial [Thiolinea sp.]
PDINCILQLETCREKHTPNDTKNITQTTAEPTPESKTATTADNPPPQTEVDINCILQLSGCNSQDTITTDNKD